MSIELKGTPGELRMTVQVKRASTGKVETHELVGHVVDTETDAALDAAINGNVASISPQPEPTKE